MLPYVAHVQARVLIILVLLSNIACFKFGGLGLRPSRLLKLHSRPSPAPPDEPAFTDYIPKVVIPTELHGESGNLYWDSCTKDVDIDLQKPLGRINEVGLHELRIRRFPHKKEEAWIPTNLKRMFSHKFTKPHHIDLDVDVSHLIDTSCQNSCLVFINGVFAPRLSSVSAIPQRVIAWGLNALTAEKQFSGDQESTIQRLLKFVPEQGEWHPFGVYGSNTITVLNMANIEDAAVVIVPDGVDAGPPIQVLFCNTEQPLPQSGGSSAGTSSGGTSSAGSAGSAGSGSSGSGSATSNGTSGTSTSGGSGSGSGTSISTHSINSDTTSTTNTHTTTTSNVPVIDHRQSSVDPSLVTHATYPRLIVLQGNNSHLHLKQSYHTILEKSVVGDSNVVSSGGNGAHNTANSDSNSTNDNTHSTRTTHATHTTHTTNPTYTSTLLTRPIKTRKMLPAPTTEMYKTTMFNAHFRAKVDFVLHALAAVNGKDSGSDSGSGSDSDGSSTTTLPVLAPVGAMSPGLVVARSTVEMGRGAIMYHTYVQDLSKSTRLLESTSVSMNRSRSSYEAVVLQLGSALCRINHHAELNAPFQNISLNSLTLAGTNQQLDLHSAIHHNKPSGVSDVKQRNIIGDLGEAIFKGRVRIPAAAKKSASNTRCKGLMVGRRARMQAMPTNEVGSDNCDCAHGVTITELDESSMFYLASRGISRQVARAALMTNFVFNLLEHFVMDRAAEARVMAQMSAVQPPAEEDAVTKKTGEKIVTM